MNTITRLICEKNRISYIVFDIHYKIIEFNASVANLVDDSTKLHEQADVRDVMWELIGIEEQIEQVLKRGLNKSTSIVFPMIYKNRCYYDLEVELFESETRETLCIVYLSEKSQETMTYIKTIQEINKKTLIYDSQERKQQQNNYELINKKLLNFNVDMDGYITYVNSVFIDFFALNDASILGKHFSHFFTTRSQKLQTSDTIILNAINYMQKSISFHASIIPRKKGSKIYENTIICQDISYLKVVEEELQYAASHDSLTGLANKTELLKKIEDAMLTMQAFALCCIDIKKLKQINEEYGYHAGDMLLKHIARILQQFIRKNDFITRADGDRFYILFGSSSQKYLVEKRLQELQELVLKRPLVYTQEDVISFELQFGLSYFPSEAKDIDELFNVAHKRLYR